MSPDRLEALRRQRDLVAQHLAWLDSEIAAATPTEPFVAVLVTNPPVATTQVVDSPVTHAAAATAAPVAEPGSLPTKITPPPEPPPEVLAAANARADEIIAQYSAVDRFDPQSTRRGCILLASAVFLLGLAGAMFAYLFYYKE